MKRTGKFLSLLLALAMICSLFVPAMAADEKKAAPETGKIVILHTNDVHCGVDQAKDKEGKAITNIGYAGVAALKKEMQAQYGAANVTLLDAGDAIQGGSIGTLSKGSYIVDIMNQVGYDLAVPGNHEFDYGMDNFLALTKAAKYTYFCSNFVDKAGKPVFDAYKMMTYGDTKVAYVGIDTPEAFTKSNPSCFQDAKGNYIYSFCEKNEGKDLYANVQKSVDNAKKAGADLVVAVGHLGIDTQSSPWMSTEVVANTTGIDLFIDGHSHSTYNNTAKNKDGKEVTMAQTGTKLENIGKITIDTKTKKITTELVNAYGAQDPDTAKFIGDINAKFEDVLKKVVAKTSVDLTTKTPAGDKRAVRSAETNLGDLCADGYRLLLGADLAFVNGGGVRADIKAGDITYEDIISVHPFGNEACMIETTGQQILDALEMSVRSYPGENGGFLQVSGITFDVDTSIASTVKLSDKKEFVSVDGARRISNVKIGEKALDPAKTYTLASHNYMLKSGGDGFTMFMKDKVIKDCVMIDNQVLINYIVDKLAGVVGKEYENLAGQGRINLKYVGVEPGKWYVDSAKYVMDNGVMASTGSGFDPTGIITRATVLQTLYNMEGKPGVKPGTYTDIQGKWYAAAVNWAEGAKVVTPGADKLFGADSEINRGDLMVLLHNYAQYKKLGSAPLADAKLDYADLKDLPETATAAALFCTANGVIGGKDGKRLAPKDTATRAELAQILMNFAKLTPNQTKLTSEEFLKDHNAWFRTGKASYVISGMTVSKDTSFRNKLEGTDYTAKNNGTDVVLKGTTGEQWISPMEKVFKTYTKKDGTALSAKDFTADTFIDLKTKAVPNSNFAIYVPLEYKVEVKTPWGDVLYANRPEVPHGMGDYLVCAAKNGKPDLTDVWVVNGAMFPTTYDQKEAPAVTTVKEISKYGNVTTALTVEAADAAGFVPGDVLKVTVGKETLDLPYGTGYSNVETASEIAIRDAKDGVVELAINMGNFARVHNLAVGDPITITMGTKKGFLKEFELSNIDSKRTNVRTDYKSDEIFANFRMIKMGKIPGGVLYRSSSPVSNELGRAAYADALCKAEGIATVINLADSKEDLEGYFAAEGFASPYYKGLYDANKICYLDMGVDFEAKEFAAKLKTGLEFMIANKGPYVIHCTEGKDRAGFVSALLGALMGGSRQQITEDYMTSFTNYYHIEKNSEQYKTLVTKNIEKTLRQIVGISPIESLLTANLQKGAETYLTETVGLTAEQVTALKTALSTPIAAQKAA